MKLEHYIATLLVLLGACVAPAESVGETASDSGSNTFPPASCDDPGSEACLQAMSALCRAQDNAEDCTGVEEVPGDGVALYCGWARPRVVWEDNVVPGACSTFLSSEEPGECYAIAFPGDIACGSHWREGEDGSIVVLEQPECEPLDWNECSSNEGLATCTCSVEMIPESCKGNPESFGACEADYAELCESFTTEDECTSMVRLLGGEFRCDWAEPVTVTLTEDGDCVSEPVEPRCVGISSPGDLACSPTWKDDNGVRIFDPEPDCHPLGWTECGSSEDPEECSCFPGL